MLVLQYQYTIWHNMPTYCSRTYITNGKHITGNTPNLYW